MAFEEGEKVLLLSGHTRYHNRSYDIRTIHKVYKTGRFVLIPGGQQYRQTGTPTGDYSYSHTCVVKYDPELIATIDAERALRAKRAKLHTLMDALRRLKDEDAAKIWDQLPDNIKELAND